MISKTLNRQGYVLVHGRHAGIISEFRIKKDRGPSTERYAFQYLEEYLEDGQPIGHNYPITETETETDYLPPFFSNLLSEGWLRQHQSQRANLAREDEFGLLLANGRELIGAISIIPLEAEHNE